jgi:GT2 family glycosyltransferase
MRAPPKVSLILTCYNLGQYLDAAVDSVLAQTCQDFEIVIIDDGSTDPETVALLRSYDRPRTRVVRIENRGLSGARNEGIRQTSGAYVCTLDADDLLEHTHFEKSAAVLDGDSSIAFVSHWLRTFGDEERDWTPTSAEFPALLDMNTINGAALVRRDALLAVGGYDESMRHGCEDWDLWISMVERGLRGVILPEVLFFYRRRADSMSRVMMKGETHVALYRYLIEKHRPSFTAHLPALLLRRELDRATVLRESHDLELDWTTVLGPETERLRDGLRVARRKLERLRAQQGRDVELARRQSIMTEMDTELARRQAIMTEMDTELARRQSIMTEMDAELARRAQMIDEKEVALGQQQQAITEQVAELARRGDALADRTAQLAALDRRAAELGAELQRDRDGIAGLQREIQMLRGSFSWRFTRPLRTVYSRLFERK